MGSLTKALRSKEGRAHLFVMFLGILIACAGGYLFRTSAVLCDIVVIVGSVVSMAGAEQFCRLIVRFQSDIPGES